MLHQKLKYLNIWGKHALFKTNFGDIPRIFSTCVTRIQGMKVRKHRCKYMDPKSISCSYVGTRWNMLTTKSGNVVSDLSIVHIIYLSPST